MRTVKHGAQLAWVLVREFSTEPLARRFVRELSFVRGCAPRHAAFGGAGCVRELSFARKLWIFFSQDGDAENVRKYLTWVGTS